MSLNKLRASFFVSLVLICTCGYPRAATAQTADEAAAQLAKATQSTPDEMAIQKVVLKGYEAYAHKNAAALYALFSERSPHLPAFKQFIQDDFASNKTVKIETIRVLLVRKIEIAGDSATVRMFAEIRARDLETGGAAEGFGEMDHTFHLVKEDAAWKLWQFVDTAEALVGELLAAPSDEARTQLITAKATPFTGGLLNGLLQQAKALLEEKGNYTQAALIFNVALTVGRQLAAQFNAPLGVAGPLIGLGDVYTEQGDYVRAADNYQQVLRLAEKLHSKEALAPVSVKLGNIHFQQGNYAQAMAYYQRGAKLYTQLGSKLEIAYPLANIGNAYFAQGDYEPALEYYRKSLKIYEQIFDKAGTAYLLHKLGEVYAAQQNYPLAVASLQQDLQLHEALGNRAMVAASLRSLADVRYAQGAYAEAATLSARAVELARANDSPEILWQALTSTGRANRALQQTERARAAFTEAIAVIERLRGHVAGSELDQQLFFESRTAPYYALVELLIAAHDLPAAFAYAERAKGRVLLDVLRGDREHFSKTLSLEDRSQERSLNETIAGLNLQLRRAQQQSQTNHAAVAAIEEQLRTARLDYEAFQTRIYATYPQLKLRRGEAAPLSLPEAGALLPDAKTALVEYVVTPDRVYLFVITKQRAAQASEQSDVELQVYASDIKAGELAARVAGLQQKIASNTLDFRAAARSLYDLLIKPAAAQLAGQTTICIAPDASLWELPFQALLSGENKFLLEDHAIFYVPSLSVYREMKRRQAQRTAANSVAQTNAAGLSLVKVKGGPPPAPRVLLAFGNPKLNETNSTQTNTLRSGRHYGSLPEAEREVKGLTQFYAPAASRILIGAAAREAIAKAEAGQYRVLHFATHGTFDDHNPMYSHLRLATGDANEDGYLEAREIIDLELDADMIILSACETARGRVGAGEGLIGMTWAFFVAGSSTTVASQWKVDSASTTMLMTNFHRLLTTQPYAGVARTGKAEALRGAALTLLASSQYRHPFYWAGFVVVGAGD